MVCIICIAAAATIGAAVLGPDAIAAMFDRIKKIMPDTRTTADSTSVVKWEGTFQFQRGNTTTPVPVAVYLYKGQKRLRIQVLTHSLSREDAESVQDAIASQLGVTILARTIPAAEPQAEEDHEPRLDWSSQPELPPREEPYSRA